MAPVDGHWPTQAEVYAWAAEKWPERATPEGRALKLAEEAGEVVGAVIKMAEGRKSKFDLADELGDLVLCALSLAESAGIDLAGVVPARWERVQGRAVPMGGVL